MDEARDSCWAHCPLPCAMLLSPSHYLASRWLRDTALPPTWTESACGLLFHAFARRLEGGARQRAPRLRRFRGPVVHALIIEDEFLTAQLIQDRLSELGFTSFAFAMDEEEAIAAACKRCPDLITSDVQLSRGCGIDAVRRICDEKPIPMLYITASAMMVRERCPSAVVIQKPFGMADLREAVREAREAA